MPIYNQEQLLYSCKAMVKPILEYAAVIWSPYTQRDVNMIERSQRQAAIFCNE